MTREKGERKMYQFVYADEAGNGYIDENHYAVGLLGNSFVEMAKEELILLPEGAMLTMIPNRQAVAMDKKGNFVPYKGSGWAMGALLPQGYTRTLLPAFLNKPGAAGLPLFGYAAVCAKDGELYVAAMATDEDYKWNPRYFNTDDLPDLVRKKQAQFPDNRLLKQLGHCALTYGCFTAQNIFYARWEGGIPISPVCNAQCLGCISLQPSECCPSPQSRLTFVPTMQEIVELASAHLQSGPDTIISFGQGCEGDPSMQAGLAAQAIKAIRQITSQGTINMNTNAGYTAGIKKLCQAGIDSLRISLNSATKTIYNRYYRPRNYTLANVRQSLKIAAEHGVYTYLNLLTYPGINDCEGEVENLLQLVEDCQVKAIQIRNLNIDPQMMQPILQRVEGEALGIPAFVQVLREELPHVAIGNYTKPLRQ